MTSGASAILPRIAGRRWEEIWQFPWLCSAFSLVGHLRRLSGSSERWWPVFGWSELPLSARIPIAGVELWVQVLIQLRAVATPHGFNLWYGDILWQLGLYHDLFCSCEDLSHKSESRFRDPLLRLIKAWSWFSLAHQICKKDPVSGRTWKQCSEESVEMCASLLGTRYHWSSTLWLVSTAAALQAGNTTSQPGTVLCFNINYL